MGTPCHLTSILCPTNNGVNPGDDRGEWPPKYGTDGTLIYTVSTKKVTPWTMCDRNVKSEYILIKLCALVLEYICERTTKFHEKILLDSGVIKYR